MSEYLSSKINSICGSGQLNDVPDFAFNQQLNQLNSGAQSEKPKISGEDNQISNFRPDMVTLSPETHQSKAFDRGAQDFSEGTGNQPAIFSPVHDPVGGSGENAVPGGRLNALAQNLQAQGSGSQAFPPLGAAAFGR